MKEFKANDPSTYKYNQVEPQMLEKKHNICEGCPHSAKDIKIGDKVVIVGYMKAKCEMYDNKPFKFLTDPKSFCEFRNL